MTVAARLLCIACAVAWATAGRAEPVTYVIDPEHTQPAFEISHLGLSIYRGKFIRARGRITLDAAAGQGEANVAIDVQSLVTGSPTLDQVLLGDDFFAASRNPEIVFQSTRMLFQGGAPVRVEGRLTIAGVTRPAALAIETFGCAKHPLMVWREVCGANASARISRSAFGMARYGSMLSDEVKLLIPVEAARE